MSKRLLAGIIALISALLPLSGKASEPTSGSINTPSPRPASGQASSPARRSSKISGNANAASAADAADAADAAAAALNPGAVTFSGLERYVDLKGFYSVLMPGTPAKQEPFDLKAVSYSAVANEEKQGVWTVAFADIADMGNPPYDPKKISLIINEQPKAYIEKIHGKMQALKAHGKFGYQFREIEGRIEGGPWNGGRFRINCYLAGKRMFIVSAEGKEDWVKSARTNAYFNSFEVPGATASPKLITK